MNVISIDNLQVNYEQIVALKNVSFNVVKNEFLGIIGPNGGGKTTLVKTILGTLKPKQGKLLIPASEVIGYVPQITTFDRQFPIKVKDVILTGHLPKKIKIGKRFSRHEKGHALEVMTRLTIDKLQDRQIGALSGGQLQRVLIARALMNHPTILILDEPTAGVDELAKIDIFLMLKELSKNITILMVTHDTSELIKYVDRIIYINKTAHTHEYNKRNKVYVENNNQEMCTCCPIDWFFTGEEIQKELLESKEQKNDRSDT